MSNHQLNLFGSSSSTSGVPPKHKSQRTKHNRKYNYSHWSYEQRVRHLVSGSNWISWHSVYRMLKDRIIRNKAMYNNNSRPRLPEAVKALRLQKTSKYPKFKSINKLAKYYHVSKPTLYRMYYRQYGK